jgi:hypothetical protein
MTEGEYEVPICTGFRIFNLVVVSRYVSIFKATYRRESEKFPAKRAGKHG